MSVREEWAGECGTWIGYTLHYDVNFEFLYTDVTEEDSFQH